MKSGLRELVLALVISLCALPASTLVVAAEPAGATARTVLVIGATGRTGREVVVKSLEAGYRVRALVRDELRARAALGSEVTLIVGDVRTDEGIAKAIEGADFIISALGSNVRNDPSNTPELVDYGGIRRLAEKSAKSKIRHFVLVSSMGATHRDHPLNRMYSNILTWKLKGEEALRASGVPYTIVRPGGLTEARGGEFLPMMMHRVTICHGRGESHGRMSLPLPSLRLIVPRRCKKPLKSSPAMRQASRTGRLFSGA
jgi:uncharacterized protein YbjT (DUF2867 family)